MKTKLLTKFIAESWKWLQCGGRNKKHIQNLYSSVFCS